MSDAKVSLRPGASGPAGQDSTQNNSERNEPVPNGPVADGATRVDPTTRLGLPWSWDGGARGWRKGEVRFDEATRPWNWMELDTIEAEKLWGVLVRFVAFVNTRYADRSSKRIPPCWGEHGALVEEITTLCWARWQAFESPHASIGGAQYWHTYSLPGFFDRMGRWLEDDLLPCQQGQHRDRDDPPVSNGSDWGLRTEVIRVLDRRERLPRQGTLDLEVVHPDTGEIVEVPFLENKPKR